MRLLEGKTAVITGGAQGLGLAIATLYAEHGATVVIADLDGDHAAEAADRLPGRHLGLACNVVDQDAVAGVVRAAVGETGGLHVWVNNAGILRDMTMRKMTLEDFRAVIDVHLQGTWLGLKHSSLHMREHGGGAVVNMSSISGKVGNAGQTNYSAAKAGIVGMTKAAAKELGHVGIRVNAIAPGLIQTAMVESMKPEIVAARVADIPLGRVGEPAEVAGAALFLASDLAGYVTGVVLEVGGGRHI